jgi:hypothetical protein
MILLGLPLDNMGADAAWWLVDPDERCAAAASLP